MGLGSILAALALALVTAAYVTRPFARRPQTVGGLRLADVDRVIESWVERERALRRAKREADSASQCPECGASTSVGNRFCPKCGARLGKEERT